MNTLPISFLKCHVTPKAAQTACAGWQDDVLRVRVAAQPEKGAANKALMRYLAQQLDLPQSAISLARGASSRDKLLRIEGLSTEEIKEALKVPGHKKS